MTLEEMLAREGIRKTVALYTHAVDNRRYEELRRVFAADGSIAVHGRGALNGIEQIIAVMVAGAAERGAANPGHFQRHNLTSAMIELDGPDRATAVHYVMVVTELGFDHVGMYRDVFRRSGDEWLIEQREARMEWVCPDSRFAAWLGTPQPADSF